MLADPEYRVRFTREADLASTLWHPHIVGVHDRVLHGALNKGGEIIGPDDRAWGFRGVATPPREVWLRRRSGNSRQ